MHRFVLRALVLAVSISCSGCFVVPESVRLNAHVTGVLKSATGAPLQERVAVMRARKSGPYKSCENAFAEKNGCVIAVLTPDSEGRFDFNAVGSSSCLLWLIPPLGILPCDERDYIAFSLESSPAMVRLLAFDPADNVLISLKADRTAAPFEVSVVSEKWEHTGGLEKKIAADIALTRP